MGLDSFCGGSSLTWSEFWTGKGHCGLSLWGSVIPLVYVVVVWLWYLGKWYACRMTKKKRGRKGVSLLDKDGLLSSFMPDSRDGEDGDGLDDAQRPLLQPAPSWGVGDESTTGSRMRTGGGRHGVNNTDGGDSSDAAAGGGSSSSNGEGGPWILKKGTAVHWGKLFLYLFQLTYHACVAGYDIVIKSSNDGDYKYTSHLLLTAAWALITWVEVLQHLLPYTRKTSSVQTAFPVICLVFAVWEFVKFDGFRQSKVKSLAPWDIGLLLAIIYMDVYSSVKNVVIKRYRYMNGEYSSSFWSYWNFSWYTYVITEGYKRILKTEELPVLIDDDRAANVWDRFCAYLYPDGPENVKDGQALHVGRNVVRLGGQRYVFQALLAFLSAISQLIPPLALHEITEFMTSSDEKDSGGVTLNVVVCTAGLFASSVIANYSDTMMFKVGRRLGIRARSALISAVFRKAMQLDMSSANAGQLQNLISVDAESVLNLMVFQMFMWGAILRLVAVIVLLFWVLGISAISGLSLVFLTLPMNKVLVTKLKQYQLDLMAVRDRRMSTVNESMQGIRIIKLFAWEERFVSKILDTRQLELIILKGYMLTLGCFMVVIKSSPTLIGLVTFLVHTKGFGYELTAATGFTALALFNQLRMPLIVLPDTFNYYIQAKVGFDRVGAFLSKTSDDVRNKAVFGTGSSDRNCASLRIGEVVVEKGTFRWRTVGPLEPPTLVDINLHVKPGQLVCVYGPTGAGKSSLLMAMLQELVTTSGRCLMNGQVAYASQRAWIQNSTLRDNILFGSPYDARKYNKVLEACALKSDLEILEGGDMTEIGEKGVNLSGGQQQRVSLARAVYNNADILLLDDVLSAVDAHVGKHIFDKCMRGVLSGKTRILVTHQISLTAHYADQIIVLNADGSVRSCGTYESFCEGGESAESNLAAIVASSAGPQLMRRASSSSIVVAEGDEAAGAGAVAAGGGKDTKADMTANAPAGKGSKIIEDEKKAIGRPKLSLYLDYFRYCGGMWFGFMVVFLSVSWNVLTIAQSFVLKDWINAMAKHKHADREMWDFIVVSMAGFVVLLVRTIMVTTGSYRASRVVHTRMTERVFAAPIGWFDATPLGRIFNRFSSDINTLDKDLMNDLSAYGDVLLSIFGTVGVIVVAIPILSIGVVPVLGLCYYYAERYLQTSRQLKRLEAVNRSPVYANFSESVSGVATIRAYGVQDRFIKGSEKHVNYLNRAHMFLWISNYWLTSRVRNIGAVVVGMVGFFLIANVGTIDGATSGLVITYALQFTLVVVFTIRSHAQMEMSVNSIERLDEYCSLPSEAPREIPGHRPPAGWPSGGEIAISNLTLQYASNAEPVLHGVSFFVPAHSRVGIVGRTGAGKSSLMTALFRMVEPAPGTVIEIDGVNILEMGLHDLRKALAIIPQEPTLFEGTVRSNIDPFDEYSDSEIWEALANCHLKDYISSTSGKLEHEVAATGSNLSVGQRQLMCMARALLRRAKVLIMDEATANVDSETDIAIQDTMRTGFQKCTVLCIAHRLHTVAWYDRVLVLDRGRVSEYDTPLNLIMKEDSKFRSMCESTGDLDTLIKIAKEGYKGLDD